MLVNNYKIIILGKNIYREYSLADTDNDLVQIGTTKNCQVRFKKSNFFGDFQFSLSKTPSGWQLNSGDGVYFTVDDVMKVFTKDLSHGDKLSVKYENNNSEIFKINFFIDFDSGEKNYERVIDVSNIQSIKIGGSDNCDIHIQDRLLEKDSILLTYKNREYSITDNNTKYGVYVNGKRIKNSSRLNNQDFFMVVGYSFYLKDNKIYTSKLDNITINNLSYKDISEQNNSFDYPKFNRNTRMKYIIPNEEIEILNPQPKAKKPKTNVMLAVAPTLALLALTVVLRGSVGGGSSFILYSAAAMSIGMFTTVAGFIVESKRHKKEENERKTKYIGYIQEKESDIAELRKKEKEILEEIYTPIGKNLAFAREFDKRLFERDMNDEDFLDVRIGTGMIESNCKIKYKPQDFKDTEDELASLPEEVCNKYAYLNDSTIVSRLSQCNAVGIVGNKSQRYSVLKNMTIDISTRHFYKDVKMFYMFSSEDCERLSWLRWLKHVDNEGLNIRNIMYDEESKNTNLEYLYSELSQREAIRNEKKEQAFDVRFVVFVFDRSGIEKHPISKYIEYCNELGFVFVFFEEFEELLPKGCTEIVRMKDNNSGVILLSSDSNNVREFSFKAVSDEEALACAVKLSAIEVDEVNLDSELTKNISIFQLLDILSVDDLDLSARWKESMVYKSMAAPLGVKIKNEKVYLDLNEKKHGPHGLVAGTTGSGKSEILQSYILSMATLFHPYEAGFVIIDFKGGGMVNQFKDLPHLIGAITNIDGREIDRSLMSIKAELRARQEVFSRHNVNHIDSYIKLYKEGKASKPIPHLIIIVDEFAELKSEYPDFMKELISAARIGRSLGVHLILATQKPSGVVDNQIWSNSKFKLCLKVQTKDDSNEVLKTPLAAEIIEPGRAYLQVGNNEIFELFQSAYSGASATDMEIDGRSQFEINSVNLWGKRQAIFSNKVAKSGQNSKNQLQAIVEYINKFCEDSAIAKLPGICLPPLQDVIYIKDLSVPFKNIVNGLNVTIGLYDDPEQQLQSELQINLTESNTAIFGSSQSGKTTMLQTMIYQLMDSYSPAEVNMYIIDCGNMALKVFEEANHVGGVVLPSEEEKLAKLFKMLRAEISNRKAVFVQRSIGTFRAYKEAGYIDLPQMLLVIDNMVAFREYFSEYDEELLNLSREGQSVGINIIITSAQTIGLGYKLMANYGNRIALNCNDKSEYSSILDRCRMEPKNVPGRGLVSIDKRIIEFQTALCVTGSKEVERVANLKKFIMDTSAVYIGKFAKKIPQVPKVARFSEIYNSYKADYTTPYSIPIGIGYSEVELIKLDLLSIGMLAVTGKEKSGKTNFIKTIMATINKNVFKNLTEAYILDSRERQLEKLADYGFVKKYSVDIEDVSEILQSIVRELEGRQEAIFENRNQKPNEVLQSYPLILLLIEHSEFIEKVSKDKELLAAFNKITKQLKNMKVAVIFTDVEDTAVGFGTPELLKQIKENKKVIVFNDLSNQKLFEVNLKVLKQNKKLVEIGDGYIWRNEEFEKIKTILLD